ncbi:serine hydrolase domain-containing protein [Lentimicrobium sp. S6]|uniref:serine hydrolase domain-containing protein n=1 Tax=Lentimicrobium sp. S6 TaxID=2735872 RepID=UPI001551E17F|nr:serine hydrolase domain-containing protein [Lentimicrobium sp. S6]NPD47299.1 serine hydrolase [Lentimicrobium sp. S6]
MKIKIIWAYTAIVINVLLNSFNAYSQTLNFAEIDKLINQYAQNGMFNGCVLAAEGSNVIYQGAYGLADFENKTNLMIDDVFGLGSIAKQFTATGIMILIEKGEIEFNNKLIEFFPEFVDFASEVTIHHLLTHTSGLFDYLNEQGLELNNQMKIITPKEAFDQILNSKRLKFKPGTNWSYSNSGYFLLSLIIEKVSGKFYHEFISEQIFIPLGMKSSSVNYHLDTVAINRIKSYEFQMESDWDLKLKVNGESGLYSTVHDILLWNQSLSSEKLLSEKSLNLIFQPTELNDGKKINYGFGWHIQQKENEKLVYHRGATAGFRCHNEYNLANEHSIIIFTNDAGMSEVFDISNNIRNILNNKPITVKKRPLSNYLFDLWYLKGLKVTQDTIKHLLINGFKDRYSRSESRLNTLGYHFLESQNLNEALEIFKLIVKIFPQSANAFDSLGEAHLKAGNIENAIENYEKSLRLDPENLNVTEVLRFLKE